MIKYTIYDNASLGSAEIDGTPYADMKCILMSIIPGSWPDYQQVLNSSEDMQFDLEIKFIDDRYWIPIEKVSAWLYSFSLAKMQGKLYDKFRIYRRDVEKVLRATWALPAVDLWPNTNVSVEWTEIDHGRSIYELNNIFDSYGIPEDQLQDIDVEGRVHGPLHYLEYVCGGSHCGSRGHMVCEMIQYIEQLPNGEVIFEYINDILSAGVPEPTDYLDDYLDELNIFISGEASRFIGEL